MKKPKPTISRASGAPFSDEDIQLIGAELLKIAAANRVGDIRVLDKKIVWAAIKADPKHPLRKFYDWNVQRAAEKHWIHFTHTLIAAVRIERGIGKFTRPYPLTVVADLPRLQYGTVRKRMLTEDALLNDPVFASLVGIRLRDIEKQLGQLEALIAARNGVAPAGVGSLVDGLRDQFERHYSSLKAAE